MTQSKLNLVRIHDRHGSHLAWQTDRERRQARQQRISQWCSDTSLAGVAAVAKLWKLMRRERPAPVTALAATPERTHLSPCHRMRIDTQA